MNRFKDIDLFGQPVTLNVGGSDTVTSFLGSFLSLVMALLISIYTIQRFGNLKARSNP